MSNVTATVNSLANLLGNTSPEVKRELEKLFSLTVAEVTGGVAASMDTLLEAKTAVDLKAPIASPTFTGTVAGVTATMVGLGNCDNTSDANKPVSTAQQTALNLKANIASPTFTGTVGGVTSTMVGLGNFL